MRPVLDASTNTLQGPRGERRPGIVARRSIGDVPGRRTRTAPAERPTRAAPAALESNGADARRGSRNGTARRGDRSDDAGGD